MLDLIGLGVLMGLAFAMPPGIVTAETFRRGMSRGVPAALGVQLGSLIGDAAYALLALAGLAALAQNPLAQRALGIFGAAFLLYLALNGIRTELRARDSVRNDENANADYQRGAFRTGMLLSLTNPWAIGFWLSLSGALASIGATDSASATATFFASFFGACVAYAFLMAFVVGLTRRAVPEPFGRAISIACSILIGLLGVGVAYQVVTAIGT